VCAGDFNLHIIFLAIGVFLLAGGAGALNQVKERRYDARMERTRHRPIPSGKISAGKALTVAILFIICGALVLYFFFGLITAALGLFNIFWYNLLYTNLKKVTAFAVVPGSLTGAVPALMGWTAAGGSVLDSTIIFIAFFLFIWQVPHFWLLMLKYGKEYEEAGFPTINRSVSPANLRLIVFAWIIATSASSMMVPFFISDISIVLFASIFILNILFVATFIKLSFGKSAVVNLRSSFLSLNIYMLLFMVIMAVYHLLV
jgi:protoheme IX farnesyltransferase